ncbi:CHAT domain-containing protein [Phenylobacterium sp.]|uniref:CHAT domain-containing protein n=1 Tax=Phenylobacterium sp. TaxID=1871053 RepID=UPI00286B6E4B|nr:CHAT domain-containing protein [Phenylobacterium sp.]
MARGRLVSLFGAICLLAGPAWAGPRASSAEALRAEAFVAAQWAVTSDAAAALAKVSGRIAGGDSEVAKLADRREGLLTRRRDLERRQEEAFATSETPQQSRERALIRAEYASTLSSLAEVDAQLTEAFPAYVDLTRPQSLSVKETQGLLGPDEALLLVLSNEEAAYVWVVTDKTDTWARAPELNRAALDALVSDIRKTLATTGSRARPRRQGEPPAPTRPFEAMKAHSLYKALIAPVEATLAGRTTLIVVTPGALGSLPLTLLPVSPLSTDPQTAEDLRRISWLGDRYAVASLPAVSSLKALRCHLAERPARGCRGKPKERAATSGAERLRLVGFGAPVLNGRPAAESLGPPAADQVFVQALANPAKLRELSPLPGSEAELAQVLERYPDARIRRGADATETAVKTTGRHELARARYVLFSTHGLLAGDPAAPGEPGLVLTPPETATALDDGLLTASEAAELRLAADLVVLSACNTAASDGRLGGEGLSGLARAFFYAGARGLLVSHWEVNDLATTQLMLRAFDGLEGDTPLSRAKALQAASRQVRDDPAHPEWAHPAFWSAFTLVGEPSLS